MFHNIKLYLFGIVAFVMSATSSFGVTITYNLNGGHLPSSNDPVYQIEISENAVVPANPIKDNYIFAGWCDSEHYSKVNNQDTCSTDRVGLETITNGNASKTLVHWTMPDNPTTNTTYVAMWEQDKFQVNIGNINEKGDTGDYFGFSLSAGGKFWIDWGDGNVEYINKVPSNYFYSVYSHTYHVSATDVTVRIGGNATGYAQDGSSAIVFNFDDKNDPVSVNENKSVHIFDYISRVREISGSLGAIFPTLGNTTGLATNSPALMAIQPRFAGVFSGCGYNFIGKIPDSLFDGIYGVPVEYMFADMFNGSYNVQGYIPPTLFINLDKQTTITNQFNDAFTHTSVATSCSWYQENGVPLSQYITGFEEYFDGHVSCAPVDSVICKAGESFSGTKCVACSGAGCLTQATTFKCNGMAANATHDECNVPVYNITYEIDGSVWTNGEPANFYIPGVGYSFYQIPSKPGYFFNGWYDEDNNWTYSINVSAQDSGDKTFYIRMGLLTIDCPAGQYAYGVPGMVSCAYCLDGYYCPGGSELSVENPGLYSCETGSHPACDCDDGYVYDYTASACILNPCSTGYVWDGSACACDENNYVCVNAGEYIVHYDDWEWADRAQCYSGHYCPGGAWLKSEVSDNAGLIPCDINTAAPDGSMSACIPCGENGYTDTTGATECSCNEGYGWSYKTNTCISATCPTGYMWDSKAGECVCDEDNYACCDVGEYAHYEPDGGKKGDKGDYYACWECEPGNYCEGGLWEISQLNGDTGMTSCGVDTFAPYEGMSACMSCPEHGHADAGADACVCDEGYGWSEADNMCLPANCPTGYVWYEKSGHCICDDDNYVCCYDGSYAYYENYDDGKGNAYTNYGCSKCDAGHYCPGGVWQKSEVEASGSVGQILCDMNTAEPWGESSTCVSCGEHGHTETTGATECICDEGYAWSFYRRQCVSTTCPTGYVWNSKEGCICDKDNYLCCDTGEYVEYGEKGDYYCSQCKPGHYCPGGAWVTSELNGLIGSTSCDINTVAPKSGMSACVSCGEHGHTDTAGATECICDEGYGWSYATNTCVSTTCPTGYVWASKDGECVCDKDNYVCADAGEYIVHYDLSKDWVDRAQCYSGNYCPGGAWLKSEVSDNSGMIPCGMNTVAPDDGMDACIPCGNHGRTYITGAEWCVCDVKYEWDGEECLCLPGVVCGSDCLTKEVTIMGAPMCLVDFEHKTHKALSVKGSNGSVYYINLTQKEPLSEPTQLSSGHTLRIIAKSGVYEATDVIATSGE